MRYVVKRDTHGEEKKIVYSEQDTYQTMAVVLSAKDFQLAEQAKTVKQTIFTTHFKQA